jgi:hypothetical protein
MLLPGPADATRGRSSPVSAIGYVTHVKCDTHTHTQSTNHIRAIHPHMTAVFVSIPKHAQQRSVEKRCTNYDADGQHARQRSVEKRCTNYNADGQRRCGNIPHADGAPCKSAQVAAPSVTSSTPQSPPAPPHQNPRAPLHRRWRPKCTNEEVQCTCERALLRPPAPPP